MFHFSRNGIDPSNLCIKSGKLAWILYCDLMCLNYDGNIIDASVTALCASLQNGKAQFEICEVSFSICH